MTKHNRCKAPFQAFKYLKNHQFIMEIEDEEQGISHHVSHFGGGENVKALKITSWLTGVYFVIELGLGIYSAPLLYSQMHFTLSLQ